MGDVLGKETANLKLKLTPDQAKAVKHALGEDVPELNLTVEEFGIHGDTGKMKVLRVQNVAVVQTSAMGGGQVVN